MFEIEEELKKLPGKPGVYLMHDEKDKIIYIGKAINLKNRVRQYFQLSRSKGIKIDRMVQQIQRFEYIITDSEVEALVLECNLIKEHHPKYNTMLMDDKGYPFIKITTEEAFPRIMLARQVQKDKAKYFGPYISGTAVKDTISLIRKLYSIRSCNRRLPADMGKERPCLNYHIKQCEAPCQGYIEKEEYHKKIEKVTQFLNGKYEEILNELKQKMEDASECMEYERAAEYRELLQSVSKIAQKQKITTNVNEERDILAIAMGEKEAVVQIFFVRNGRLIGRDYFYLNVATAQSSSEILQEFIKQFYSGAYFIPKELMIQEEIEDKEVIEEWLSQKRGHHVSIYVPQKGKKEKLIELAKNNADMVLSRDKERLKREEKRTVGAVKEIEELLNLNKINRMEAFDISNISGFASVGAMVVYEKGKPKRNDYRKFRIKNVQGVDDYASMYEMLSRRFEHGLKEMQEGEVKGKFQVFPDLIMMDGGKGHVNIAMQVLQELQLEIPVCGMVKDNNHRTRGLYYQNEEKELDTHSEGFRLVTRIQDEVHRFAIEYHRKIRSKSQVQSILDDIPGIGPTRRKDLMKHFQNLEEIKNAEITELKEIPSINEKTAKEIYNFFH